MQFVHFKTFFAGNIIISATSNAMQFVLFDSALKSDRNGPIGNDVSYSRTLVSAYIKGKLKNLAIRSIFVV